MKDLIRNVIIKSILLFLGWILIYHGLIRPNGKLDHWFSMKVVEFTKFGLAAIGFDTEHGLNPNGNGINPRYIYVDSMPVVSVADGCNGVELIALFIGFFIVFPGRWKFKIVFITIGSFLVFLINVLREMALALNYMYFKASFDLNHKYTYVLIVYGLIFIIWRYWLNNYSFLKDMTHHDD